MLDHVLLATSDPFANAYLPNAPRPHTGSTAWWLYSTPLHILWAGPEMVTVFFVLSGFVLALPAVRRGYAWFDASYYPRRLARLYLPVWGAMAIAAALHLLAARHASAASSWWLAAHPDKATLHGTVHTASLWWQADANQFAGSLWSLRYEVGFSVLLPLALLLPIATRQRPLAAAATAAATVALILYGAHSGSLVLRFIPVCELGALLAFHAHRLPRPPRAPAAVLAALLLAAPYAIQSRPSSTATGLAELSALLGATLAVHTALGSSQLASPPFAWLGSRSFSLYLIHEPIVVTLAFALGGSPATVALLALALPASLLAAEAFHRTIERPATIAARKLGGRMAAFTNV